jgi:hypothetical protein
MSNSPKAAPAAAPAGRRSRVVLLASTAYVGAASLRAAGGRGLGTWLLVAVAMALAWIASRRSPRILLAMGGLAVVLASVAAPDPGGWVGAFGLVGATLATVAARRAIARVTAPPGLATAPPASPVPAVAVLLAGWGVALASEVGAALNAAAPLAAHPRAWAGVAEAVAGLVLAAETLRAAHERRLELGVAARMRASAALVLAVAGVTWAAWFVGMGAGEPLARIGVASAAVLVSLVCLRGDPVDIARTARRALTLVLVGGPVLMLAATTAEGRPMEAPAIVVVAGVLALVIGAAASVLEEPLRPARGAWLDAVVKAHEALLRTDPDEAIREVLVALRAPAGASSPSPELWTFDPMRLVTVDAAGYAHEREAALPGALVAIASAEPEATLRMEVLDALVVRRPDLRALARWMDDSVAMLAVVVTRAGEAEGLLVLPRGRRGEPLSLEEARAIKRLADALAALCHARAALARSLDRERQAVLRAEETDLVLARLQHESDVHVGRHELAASRLARPATVGVYSAAARMAWGALERRVRASTTVFVVAPSGVDPVPYVARAHLGGPRAASPLVLVDGTSSREHDPARWRDPLTSPLALADRGLLVLLDGASLPVDVQQLVARALSERRPPWERAEPLDVALTLTAVVTPGELASSGRLDPSLAARMGDAMDAPITLPRLRDRPEDVHAIVTDRLAREGLRVKGTPVGIDDAAFARLVEHPFLGEDAELVAIVQRLVAACSGDVVRAADVDALGLDAKGAEAAKESAPKGPRRVRG